MGGGVSSFLLYLSELSFVIGITAEKNKQTNKKNKTKKPPLLTPACASLTLFSLTKLLTKASYEQKVLLWLLDWGENRQQELDAA